MTIQQSCTISRIKGGPIFLTLRYGPENSQLVPSKQSNSSSFEHKRRVQSHTRCFLQAKDLAGLASSSKHCQANFSTSRSSTNRSVCNKVVFSMPLYMTWDAADTEAIAIDALRQPWTCNLVCAFPPIPLIPLVLKKLEQFPSMKMLLVAPAWPQKPWFPSLLNLAYSQPLRLPYRKDLVIDLSTNKAPPNIRNLNLTVWPF